MNLEIEPLDGLVDAAPAIRVAGVRPGGEVAIQIEASDADGHPWVSILRFCAGEDGTVDIARDTPLGDEFSAPDPEAPWWSMAFADETVAPVAFAAPADAMTATVSATGPGGQAESAQAVRRWQAGTAPEAVSGDGWSGSLWSPVDGSSRGAVLLVPGSTGAAAMAPAAALLASHGYTAMVAAYMQEPGLPPALCEIPIERIVDAGRVLAGRAGERAGERAGPLGGKRAGPREGSCRERIPPKRRPAPAARAAPNEI